jgi:hypothetical protein
MNRFKSVEEAGLACRVLTEVLNQNISLHFSDEESASNNQTVGSWIVDADFEYIVALFIWQQDNAHYGGNERRHWADDALKDWESWKLSSGGYEYAEVEAKANNIFNMFSGDVTKANAAGYYWACDKYQRDEFQWGVNQWMDTFNGSYVSPWQEPFEAKRKFSGDTLNRFNTVQEAGLASKVLKVYEDDLDTFQYGRGQTGSPVRIYPSANCWKVDSPIDYFVALCYWQRRQDPRSGAAYGSGYAGNRPEWSPEAISAWREWKGNVTQKEYETALHKAELPYSQYRADVVNARSAGEHWDDNVGGWTRNDDDD